MKPFIKPNKALQHSSQNWNQNPSRDNNQTPTTPKTKPQKNKRQKLKQEPNAEQQPVQTTSSTQTAYKENLAINFTLTSQRILERIPSSVLGARP
jgi:hypothetical protein